MPRRNRGGKGGAEPRARIATREARAWELSIAGKTQREIAGVLDVSQPAVCKMLERAGKTYYANWRGRGDARLARLIARLERLYDELSAAWEKSKIEKTQRRHRRVDGVGAGDESQTMVEATAVSREGDPRFTAQMLKVLVEIRAIIDGPGLGTAQRESAPYDPQAAVRYLADHYTLEELHTLRKLALVKVMGHWTEAEKQGYTALTPEDLRKLANMKEKDLTE